MAGHHLLIVDDEDNLRSMLRAALRHHGFDVAEADNGRAALDAIARERPDLILLDVMMPELDGFEVCRRLRADGDDTSLRGCTHCGTPPSSRMRSAMARRASSP